MRQDRRWWVVNTIGLIGLIVGVAFVSSPEFALAHGKAKGLKGEVKATFVPFVDAEEIPSSIAFEKGKLKIKGNKGEVKFDLKGVSAQPGTSGELLLNLAVNGADPVTVSFLFVLESDNNGDGNGDTTKAELTTVLTAGFLTLDPMETLALMPGDIIELREAMVMSGLEPVAVMGVVFEPQDDDDDDDDDDE